jgi:hypothetical protein
MLSFRCGGFQYSPDDGVWRVGNDVIIALWECGYNVIGCRIADKRLDFVTLYVEDPTAITLIARSEQGLLFWLFSWIIEDQDWANEESTLARLRTAAAAVGFRSFDEVEKFEREFGNRTNYEELLRARSLQL